MMLLLFLGGGLGAVSRYLMSAFIFKNILAQPIQYLSMAFVNIFGSFLLGMFDALFSAEESLFLLFAVGFCGAFTTFSTFSYETVTMIQQKQYKKASIYIGFTIVLCLVFYAFGQVLFE